MSQCNPMVQRELLKVCDILCCFRLYFFCVLIANCSIWLDWPLHSTSLVTLHCFTNTWGCSSVRRRFKLNRTLCQDLIRHGSYLHSLLHHVWKIANLYNYLFDCRVQGNSEGMEGSQEGGRKPAQGSRGTRACCCSGQPGRWRRSP